MRLSKITSAVIFLSVRADAQLTPAELSQMLEITNRYRAGEGRGPLCLNDRLLATAQKHSDDQARFRKMSHDLGQYGGSDFGQRSRDSGYNGGRKAENVAFRSRNSVEAVNEQWWNSPGHKKNILGDYTHIGIAMAKGENGYYYTQVFGNSKSESCSAGTMGEPYGPKETDPMAVQDKKQQPLKPIVEGKQSKKSGKGKRRMGKRRKRRSRNKDCPKKNQ